VDLKLLEKCVVTGSTEAIGVGDRQSLASEGEQSTKRTYARAWMQRWRQSDRVEQRIRLMDSSAFQG